MSKQKSFSNVEITAIVILRVLIGWHLLYEGFAKLLSPGWSSIGFLKESQWILSGFANWIISHAGILKVVDFMNTWGLIAIGAGLILGFLTRIAAYSGVILLLLYYFNNAPIIGIEYSIPSEGNYLVVSKTLIEAAALLLIAVLPSGKFLGIDSLCGLICKSKKGDQ